MKKKRRSKLERQTTLTFRYYEQLRSILRDLKSIDKLIPKEISRIPTVSTLDNASAIIVGRKDDLLAYIQTICRDHMYWSEKLMNEKAPGWRV